MNFTKTILKNGLRVITVPEKDALAATVLVLVEAGSKYETKKVNGLSHFLEHMCFKGTTKRPTALAISSELDGLGAQYNAFTGQEYTGYYAKVQSKHLDHALDIVSDMYLHPTFEAMEIEKEKGVIIEEINLYEDQPHRKIQDLILELLYGDQPAGWDVAGKKEIIRSLGRGDFTSYRDKHYVGKATTVIVAGGFDERRTLALIGRHFATLSMAKKHAKLATRESQKKPGVLVRHKASDQTHLVLAFRSHDLFHKDLYALEVLASILGGGMSSRLFQRVREQMGAAYYVRAAQDASTDHGFLQISAGVDHTKLKDVLIAMLDEVKKVVSQPVGADELRRVKDHFIGNLFLSLETSESIAQFYGMQEVLRQKMKNPDELARAIERVSARDIQRGAREIFHNRRMNLALIGPFENPAEFATLLRI